MLTTPDEQLKDSSEVEVFGALQVNDCPLADDTPSKVRSAVTVSLVLLKVTPSAKGTFWPTRIHSSVGCVLPVYLTEQENFTTSGVKPQLLIPMMTSPEVIFEEHDGSESEEETHKQVLQRINR